MPPRAKNVLSSVNSRYPMRKQRLLNLPQILQNNDLPILVNVFNTGSSSLKKIYCCLSHRYFDFQRRSKKLYTLIIKNPRINNPRPPFLFPIPALRLSDTSPTKNFMTKFTFLCSNFFSLRFLAIVISIYQV